jgi:hypothetical protein
MKLNKLLIVFLLSVTTIFAQDINTTEVKVVEGFKPTIPEASRLNENATFADTIKKDRTQNYEVIDAALKSDYKTRPLQAAKVKADKILQLFGTTISFGTGYRIASKSSVVYNSLRSKTFSYGLLYNHINNNIKIDNKEAGKSQNNLHIYSKKIKEDKIYFASMEYQKKGVYTYGNGTLDRKGFDNAITENNPFYSRFSFTKLFFSTLSTEKEQGKLKHNTSFFISDLNELSENQIHLSTNLSKTIKGFPFSLEIELNDYLNYNNPDTRFESTSVQSFHFSPSTSISKYGVDFNLGLELHYLSDGTPFEVFPQIKATKELVKDVLLVYGGLRHSEHRHTFKTLSDENPYIHSYGINQSILGGNSFIQQLKTTDTDELYVAMRNVLGEGEVFEGSVAYGSVQNLAEFSGVSNGNYNRFLVDYIDVKQLHVNANYSRTINNIISLNANADYYNWDKKVYHKPNFTCAISAPVNLRNKIKVTPSLSYMSERTSSLKFYVDDVATNPPEITPLNSQFHANLDLYYSYSKQLSAYLQLNNLTNSKQDLWRDYREVGFNGIFGLNYSF